MHLTSQDIIDRTARLVVEELTQRFLSDEFILEFGEKLQAVWSGQLKRLPECLQFNFEVTEDHPEAFQVLGKDLQSDNPQVYFYQKDEDEPSTGILPRVRKLAIETLRALELEENVKHWTVLEILDEVPEDAGLEESLRRA
jgi:hypothetical protein